MREVDHLTTEKYGIPSIILMENAAHAVARVITEKLGGSVKGKSILVLCGKGNNGGDGAALARILWQEGAKVFVLLWGKWEESSGDARANFQIVEHLKGHVGFSQVESEAELIEWWRYTRSERTLDVIVDAVFGTGLNRPLDRAYEMFLDIARDYTLDRHPALIVAIDIPSGLNADLHEPTTCPLEASVTVTFTAPKPATVLSPSYSECGEVIVISIGSPRELIDASKSQLFVADKHDCLAWLWNSRFFDDSYKNKRGHALLIAGSENYSGAAVLAGNAAMRSGVGLVTVVTPKSSKESIAARLLPEVMVRGIAETEKGAISFEAFDEIGDLLEKADSVAIGCGLSQDASTKEFIKKIVENRQQPTVVDADALNLLSPFAAKPANGERDAPLILTPHECEFMRLLGTDDKDAIKDRVAAVREFSQKHNVILVLKGERVLICEPGGKVVVNPTGNAGLGKAGNGDTLTGIIAGFVAQAVQMKIDMFETVVAAVYLAGLAGDIAEKKYSKRVMTASDVRECLVEAFESVRE
jgi:ADP-dependent NAD(P)H-hydrate dehydratase / NAD(P)H-hydrate epimerase